MGLDVATEFLKRVRSDPMLRRKVAKLEAGDVAGLVALARAAGCVVWPDDYAAFAKLLEKSSGALSETELETVTAGIGERTNAGPGDGLGYFGSVDGLNVELDVADYSEPADRKLKK
jgi:hypothetical protein